MKKVLNIEFTPFKYAHNFQCITYSVRWPGAGSEDASVHFTKRPAAAVTSYMLIMPFFTLLVCFSSWAIYLFKDWPRIITVGTDLITPYC